jgi:hypothetical protein
VNLLFFILVCYGLTQILVYGSIFNKIRPKHHFFHCPMCVGFWAGVLVFWFFNPFNFILASSYGCLSSGTSYAFCQIFGDEGINIRTNKS